MIHVYIGSGNDGEALEHLGSIDSGGEPVEVDRKLAVWWLRTAMADLAQGAPKVQEYGGAHEGSADLMVMGDALTSLLLWQVTRGGPVSQELAIWFYVLGKVARLISDYQQQRPGKADTWHDITFYSMMARRLQESGQWP